MSDDRPIFNLEDLGNFVKPDTQVINKNTDDIDIPKELNATDQARYEAEKGSRKLSASEVNNDLSSIKNPNIAITQSVVDGPKSLGDTIKNIEAKTTVIPYAQKSRQHWVTVKVTRTKDNINIELIDSKGGASKRPEAEYSSNPIKRFGQKFADKVGGLVDKVISTVVGNKELSEMKKEIQAQHPNAKITTKLTKLETQRDNMHCGRHVIENIRAIASDQAIETNLDKANTIIKESINNKYMQALDAIDQQYKPPLEEPKRETLPIMSKSTTIYVENQATSVTPNQTPKVNTPSNKLKGLG